MSFFSGLSNIFHGIGHIFDSGQSDEEKKRQQQQQQQQQVAQANAQRQNAGPVQQAPQAPPDPYLNLVKAPGPAGPAVAQPQPAAQALQKAPLPAGLTPDVPLPHASILHNITHNPVTGVVGGVAKAVASPFAYLAKADIINPIKENAAILTGNDAAQINTNRQSNVDLGLGDQGTDLGSGLEKWAGNSAGALLTVAAPGVDSVAKNVVTKGVGKFLPDISPEAAATLTKYGRAGLSGGSINAGYAGAQDVANGDPEKALTKAPENFAIGAALGGVTPIISGGLKKFVGKYISAARGDVNVPEPDELATGIKSSNPTQAHDAALQHAAQISDAATVNPQVAGAVPGTVAQPLEAAPGGLASPAAQIEEKMGAVPKDATGAPVVQDAVPAPQVPAPAQPISPAEIPPTIAPVEPVMPANVPGAPTVDTAPHTHDALVKQLGDQFADLKGDYNSRNPINLDDFKQKAAGVIANTPDADLLKSFSATDPEHMVNSNESLALARAALDRFAKTPDDPASVQAVSNILEGITKYQSKAGFAQRFIQEDFDNMPLPMKVKYIVKKIDNAWKGDSNYESLANDPARADKVEQAITDYLTSSESISGRIAKLQGELDQIAEAAKAGQPLDVDPKAIAAEVSKAETELAANNGDLVKFFQDQIPARAKSQKINDLARNMMLGSFSGRINDLWTTGNNIAHLQAQNVTQGLLAKAINFVKPGTVTDTLRGGGALLRGTKEGAGIGKAEIGGTQYAGDLQKALNNNTGARTGLPKARGFVGTKIQGATEFATNVSRGVRDQRLYQLADQEAQQQGLKGQARKVYAEARAGSPSAEMHQKADEVWKQVNNLNNNPLSRKLNSIASSLDPDKAGVGGFLGGVARNQVLPFTSWLGGNIWNSVTDKNVVASATKMFIAAGRGDAEGIVRNLAATANNAAATYALGYLLTKNGVLVHTNPEGYNDDGLYLHIGDRYVPVQFTGFFAPSLILGNAAYEGVNSKGNAADKFGHALNTGFDSAFRSYGVASALGADNNVAQTVQLMTQPNSSLNAGDATATFGAGVVNQFIPAITGDINSVLNNGLTIDGKGVGAVNNPTHEAANTSPKKINPETGKPKKQYIQSAVAKVQNRIPGLSQALPRKPGVAADDFFDRVSKGDRATNESNQKIKDAKAAADIEASDKAADIPNPADANFANAVEARLERGEYGKSISALQQQLKIKQADKNNPQSDLDTISHKIKQYQVAKDNKLSYADMKLYNSTALTDWRNMGDDQSDSYDPKTYQKLWNIDKELADAGVAGAFGIKDATLKASDTQKYSAKTSKAKSGSGSSAKNDGNTIGSLADIKNVSLGNLAPKKIANAQIPIIQKIPASQLIKKRTISVS